MLWNKQHESLLGYEAGEISGRHVTEWHVPEARDAVLSAIEAVMEKGQGSVESSLVAKDGRLVPFALTGIRFETQGQPYLMGIGFDITERKKAEDALRQAEEKYRAIFDNAVLGIFQRAPDGRYLSVNQAMARAYGYKSPEEMIADSSDLAHAHNVLAQPSQYLEFKKLLDEQGVVHDFVFEVYRKGGRGWVLANVRTVRDAQGKVLYYEGTHEDITERKRLEAQYEQAQKMEAVGRLAGGIAHDFNNILGVIMGYSELAKGQVSPTHAVARNISQIKIAAERAASLTKQLLAFSRQQIIYPIVLDLNKVVRSSMEMLKPLLGEDIRLSFKAERKLWMVKVDPGQIDQILMNLGVNARDAMPGGGKIVIETHNVELDESHRLSHGPAVPGHYVMLAMTDTGSGIAPDDLPRIFEPFFTTKGPGKGTGLGLATVYGIVSQSNGHIWVYSERDKGTTFKIYFPKVEEFEHSQESESESEIAGGSETILLVEDEEALRDVAVNLLEASGYKVLPAGNAPDALILAQNYDQHIDLLLTDVIMPNMSGTELYAHLREVRPEIKLLYMSGYAGQQLEHYGKFGQETEFLEKPFTRNSLLKKVRAILDS